MKKHVWPLKTDVFVDDATLSQMHFNLITSWENFTHSLEKKSPTVRAGIFFNTSFDHAQYLLNDIHFHLKSRLKLELLEMMTISELRQKCCQYDLIITNLSALTLGDCPIVSIHSNPTKEDFDAILDQYNTIVKNKVNYSSVL